MSFLKRIFGRGCSHRFTWPRFDNHGRHYQICLTCGAAYGMHPTGRLLALDAQVRTTSAQRSSGTGN
jgi:hypothetical protein